MSKDGFVSRWFPLHVIVMADKDDIFINDNNYIIKGGKYSTTVVKSKFTTFDPSINKQINWEIIPYKEKKIYGIDLTLKKDE